MAWIKAAELTPPENEQILIHDDEHSRVRFGRYIGGQWFIEDAGDGQLKLIERVTHWAWMLDSQTYDAGDD